MSLVIPESHFFPPASTAPDDGLIAIGGCLSPMMIVDALTHGIFPWTIQSESLNNEDNSQKTTSTNNRRDEDDCRFFKLLSSRNKEANWNGYNYSSLQSLNQTGETLSWWSPDPRAIFELDKLHIPSRIRRIMRNSKFQITFDQAFPEVMLGCGLAGTRKEKGTWISKEFYCGYCLLFEEKLAHSVECWILDPSGERQLVGAVYGVAINSFFAGESMFSIKTDASKVALFTLLVHLKERNFQLFDLQILNEHTQRLGGTEISRNEYLNRLNNALLTPTVF